MVQRKFGSRGSTGQKLDVIDTYLSMYQKALHGRFETSYIDAFAGSGEIPTGDTEVDLLNDEQARDVIKGSASRAVDINPPFSKYIFVDHRKACLEALKARFGSMPISDRMEFHEGDANIHVRRICSSGRWRNERGVIFLDPFGNQVEWETVVAIAETKALDMWYLFPAGVGVFRQIGSDGSVDRTHEAAIDRIYGTPAWRQAFFKPSSQSDLFSVEPRREKTVTPESAAAFMIERMKGVFRGGVLDEMIPLGKHAYASYYLLFAWGNPSDKATALAKKLSTAAIKAIDRKNGRLV